MSNSNNILQLQQPLTDGGIRSVNFFNGRLLTGKDLSREQAARREADNRLGLALGEGVAYGLEVGPDPQRSQTGQPVVAIKPGLAVNRLGQILRLGSETHVGLTRSFAAELGPKCLFSDCKPLVGGTYVAGAGVYVLTIAPAEKPEGSAASNSLNRAGQSCNTDATVEAVQFRLLSLDRKYYTNLDFGASTFHNELAYRCFGEGVKAAWFGDIYGAAPRSDDLLDTLRNSVLSDADVPLALVHITGSVDVKFIDLWAVRRPLAARDAEGIFGSLVNPRRLAVGRAMFLQFQAHIDYLKKPNGDLGAITAQSHFRFLPPVGIIPVMKETDLTDAKATRFFTGMTYRSPVFINAAQIESLVRDSLCYPPIDTQTIDPKTGEKDPQKGEMVWLYRVRENRMAIDFAGSGPGPRSYLVFASGHLPYIGDAQFDLAHWNYSNYALAR
jgi:hypothetical protein